MTLKTFDTSAPMSIKNILTKIVNFDKKCQFLTNIVTRRELIRRSVEFFKSENRQGVK